MRNNKNYMTKEEYSNRLATFRQNYQFVNSHNPIESGYTMGLNQFADLTPEEFSNKSTGLIVPENYEP